MKRIVALLLALALLGCTGCSMLQKENGGADLSDALLNGLKTTPAPEPSAEPTQTPPQPAARIPWMLKPDAALAAEYLPDLSEYDADGGFLESFLYDGAVLVQFAAFPGANTPESALEAMVGITGADVSNMKRETVHVNDQDAQRLRYTIGTEEDTRRCEDVLAVTEEGAMLFRTATPADLWDVYSGQVEAWLGSLRVVSQPDEPPYVEVQEAALGVTEEDVIGWWVYAGRDADPEYPILIRFEGDGRLYMNPEDYDVTRAGGVAPTNDWQLRGGAVVCCMTEDANTFEARVEWGDEGEMVLCMPDGGMYRYFKCTSAQGAAMLSGTVYERYTVEPVLCEVKLGMEPEGWGMTLLVNDFIWVWSYDEELKRKYGLEDAEFANDYETVDEDPTYQPVTVMLDGSAKFWLIDCTEDGLMPYQATPEQFVERMVTDHREVPMLAQVKIIDEYIVEVQEIFVP